jgi:hypothetical protein
MIVVERVTTARPCGFSARVGRAADPLSTTVFTSPSMSRSRRATTKCWWKGAYVFSSA